MANHIPYQLFSHVLLGKPLPFKAIVYCFTFRISHLHLSSVKISINLAIHFEINHSS
jgi:hypothetical protein